MANDKNNINELVADDDDPTAELEALDIASVASDIELESAASTAGFHNGAGVNNQPDVAISDLQSDLQSRSETINRLQYDMQQLRAKWLGLEAEIQAREQLTNTLQDTLKSKSDLVTKRNQKIKALETEIRERNEAHLELQDKIEALNKHVAASNGDDTQQNEQILAMQAGQLASNELVIKELRERFAKAEEYADQLRRQLQDRHAENGSDKKSREFLQQCLDEANDRISALTTSVAEIGADKLKLAEELASLHSAHTEEIRTIRFELGEAQETLSQHELISEQLASDLVENRGYRAELENMLSQSEEHSSSKIETIEKENRNLRGEVSELQQKLDTKGEAINCLLSELAKKTHQIESIGEIEEVIHDIDDRMSERFDEPVPAERDRVTRVLIGSIDGQELRFPLFKDRLTIGRTEQNDIQLTATHISRRHAVVVTEGDATRVIDWGSKNGVYVNAAKVTEHFLKNGDLVTVGNAEFRYEERPKREL